MTQAVRRSPPTAGVPSSRLGPSLWVSWWTKRGLGTFFTGFLPFSPTTNFIPPFLHTHLIHFRFISSALVMVRQAWSTGTLPTHGPIIQGLHRISTLDPTLCWTRIEDIYEPCLPYLSEHYNIALENWTVEGILFGSRGTISKRTWLYLKSLCIPQQVGYFKGLPTYFKSSFIC